MMKENILKTSKYVLFSIVVVLVFILLFRQCSGDESTKEIPVESSSTETNVKGDLAEKGTKEDLNEKTDFVASQKKIDSLQNRVVEKKLNSKATKKVAASKLQMGKNDQTFVHKESQTNFFTQFNEDVEEGKVKSEEILKNDIEKLTEKVNVLDRNVKALLEKMRLFYEEKKNRMLTEEPGKKEKEENLTCILDTLKDDDAYKYRDPTHVLSGGLSTYKKWTGLGFQASYTYRVNKLVSLGLQGKAFMKEGNYEGDRDVFMGFRANFHILPLFVENSRFDLYAGGTAGVSIDNNIDSLETIWCLGSSYDFCKHWGVFVEAGNMGVVGLRLIF